MNNITGITLGIVVGLALGGLGGYLVAEKDSEGTSAAEMAQLVDMMKADGVRMEKAGGMMMDAGAMLEERGTKYNDEVMVMTGKDLSANGKKHQEDGMSMTGGDMMGMMNMGGMDHSGM